MSSPNSAFEIALPDASQRLKGIYIHSQIMPGGITQVEGFVDGRLVICMYHYDGQWCVASVSNPHLNVPQLRMYLDCVQQVLARTVDAVDDGGAEISYDTVDEVNRVHAPVGDVKVVSSL